MISPVAPSGQSGKLVRSQGGEVQFLNPMQGTQVRRPSCSLRLKSGIPMNEFATGESQVEPDTKTTVVQNRSVSALAQGQSRSEAHPNPTVSPNPRYYPDSSPWGPLSQFPRIQASGRPDFLIISVGLSDRIAGSAMNVTYIQFRLIVLN